MKNFNKLTIGYIRHDIDTFNKFLGPSLDKLDGDFDLISTSDKRKPAHNYNTIVDSSLNNLVVLTHQDVSFSRDLLTIIDKTISKVGDFAALGMVGVSDDGIYRWSVSDNVFEISSADCCFLVVNKDHGISFDEKTFDDYHLYVEDYCGQAKSKTGNPVYTILVNSEESSPLFLEDNAESYLNHHSVTVSKRGFAWGRYWEYRAKLEAKWPGIKTT
jgi:hypothetical protein